MRGTFVTFEGIDGSGKSTAIGRVAKALAEEGVQATRTREETDSWLGEAVRRAVAERADPLATTYLFLADRAQHALDLDERLGAGQHVLCDRYLHSTLAYQSVTLQGRVADPRAFLRGLHVPVGLEPDHVLLFDVPAETAVGRIRDRGATTPYEKVAFLEKVRAAYLALAKADDRIHVLDASRDLDDVVAEATDMVRDWLKTSD